MLFGAGKQLGKKPTKSCTCPICQEIIVDPFGKSAGQDSIYCKGNCDAWPHRKCTGLSQATFKLLVNSSKPFVCANCKIMEQSWNKIKLAELRNEVALLKSMLSGATAQLTVQRHKPFCWNHNTYSFSNIVSSNLTSQPSRSSTLSQPPLKSSCIQLPQHLPMTAHSTLFMV